MLRGSPNLHNCSKLRPGDCALSQVVQGPVKSTNVNHSREEAVGLSTSGQLCIFTLKHFLHALCSHHCTPRTVAENRVKGPPIILLGSTPALSCLWSLIKEYHFPSQYPHRVPPGHPLNAHMWPMLVTVLSHWWLHPSFSPWSLCDLDTVVAKLLT